MVQRYIDWRKETAWPIWISPDGTAGIEMELTANIAGERIKVIIDRVFATADHNSRPIIVDLKTGAAPQWGALQLGIGARAIEATWPEVRVAGGAYFDARKNGLSDIISLEKYTPELIAHYAKQLRLAKSLGIFLPNVSPICKSCKVGKFCAINGGSEAHHDPDYRLIERRNVGQ